MNNTVEQITYQSESWGPFVFFKEFEALKMNNSFGCMEEVLVNISHLEIGLLYKDVAKRVITTPNQLIVVFNNGILEMVNWRFDATEKKKLYEYDMRYYAEDVETYKDVRKVIEKFLVPKHNYIKWAFKSSHGLQTLDTELKMNGAIYPEFYPFIPDVKQFMDEYYTSKSSILILNGHRGTGKSTLISDFIQRNQLKAITTYDNDLMKDDYFFIKFLTEDFNLLVLEDADVMLLSRLEHKNETISKLLNVSDGIVDMSSKKIIITANLDDKRDIDPAIMRPGRCFSVVDFRKLQGEEVDAACQKIGKSRPGSEREYSLAECFNFVEAKYETKFGFA